MEPRRLLTMLLDSLQARAHEITEGEGMLYAGAKWFRAIEAPEIARVGEAAATAANPTYQTVATLGFCIACGPGSPGLQSAFRSGIKWMSGRQFFPIGHPWQFEVDSLGILGVAAGIRTLNVPALERGWLVSVIDRSLTETRPNDWDRSIRLAAREIVSGEKRMGIRADVQAALAANGLAQVSAEDEKHARLLIVESVANQPSIEQAAVQFSALRWLLRAEALALPQNASLQDLVAVLHTLPHALKRWPWEFSARTSGQDASPQKWDIQNEYHVQSLLWAILVPIFPDLEDEEWLRSKGHKHPRCDLAIPSLRTIVEVKFMRRATNSDCSELTGQVAQDASLYLSPPSDFSKLVVFIWDASGSTTQHGELRNGMKRLAGVEEVIVVSRPGSWTLEDPTVPKNATAPIPGSAT